MRPSKQSRIDELERTLGIEQEGLRAEKANLARITANYEKQITELKTARNFYGRQSQSNEALLRIIENLSRRTA